jgi:GR25 family glycosyltransferase involved in LPS biosynthesis
MIDMIYTYNTNPKIQIKHLQSRPDDEREQFSRNSIKQLVNYGFDYMLIVNEPYDGLPPIENCRRPGNISKDNKSGELYEGAGLGWITGRHYGCYLAHRGALETINSDEYDYTLIFEADAYIETSLDEFVEVIYESCKIMEMNDVYYLSLSNNPTGMKTKINNLFSETAHHQDLAHAYIVRNKDKKWWLDRINDCEWDVADLWYNHIFCHHPEKRYTTNKIYSKQSDGLSLIDGGIKKWKDGGFADIVFENQNYEKPILIISSGRRINYLRQTLLNLNKNIVDLKNQFKKVWLLDDKSSLSDRSEIEILMKKYFDSKFNTIYFNDTAKFAFIDKYNIIKSLVNKDDIVFFLEDDWVLNQKFDIKYHTDNLRKNDWTQLSFTDPIWLQTEEIQKNFTVDDDYWKNPYPKPFKHPTKWDGDICVWSEVRMNNWTNNPSLVKGFIYHMAEFKYEKNFEIQFSSDINGKHIIDKKCYFNHIGNISLIDTL